MLLVNAQCSTGQESRGDSPEYTVHNYVLDLVYNLPLPPKRTPAAAHALDLTHLHVHSTTIRWEVHIHSLVEINRARIRSRASHSADVAD
eukprot:COSAG02_NODE_12384_length_1555_cov_2.844780_2_plen_90_part_00